MPKARKGTNRYMEERKEKIHELGVDICNKLAFQIRERNARNELWELRNGRILRAKLTPIVPDKIPLGLGNEIAISYLYTEDSQPTEQLDSLFWAYENHLGLYLGDAFLDIAKNRQKQFNFQFYHAFPRSQLEKAVGIVARGYNETIIIREAKA